MTIYVFLMYGKSVRDQLLSLPSLSKFCEDHKFYPVAGDEFNYSELSEEDKGRIEDLKITKFKSLKVATRKVLLADETLHVFLEVI